MSTTKIEWADLTLNPVVGCSKCSPGCDNCYAERFAARLAKNPQTSAKYVGVVDTAGKWTGKIGFAADGCFADLYNSRRAKRVFVGSMSDLFHENVPQSELLILTSAMSLMPHHTFMLLTKRPERAREMLDGALGVKGFEHIWLGVTVCNQAEADAKIPVLLSIPAAKRFVSVEPMLGQIDLVHIPWAGLGSTAEKDVMTGEVWIPGNCGENSQTLHGKRLDWVICGGESGPNARPMHPDWVRGLRDQCQDAGVPFFFKSWGEWCPGKYITPSTKIEMQNGHTWICHAEQSKVWPEGNIRSFRIGKRRAGRLLDGVEYSEIPA